jgi:hypothetical protein
MHQHTHQVDLLPSRQWNPLNLNRATDPVPLVPRLPPHRLFLLSHHRACRQKNPQHPSVALSMLPSAIPTEEPPQLRQINPPLRPLPSPLSLPRPSHRLFRESPTFVPSSAPTLAPMIPQPYLLRVVHVRLGPKPQMTRL